MINLPGLQDYVWEKYGYDIIGDCVIVEDAVFFGADPTVGIKAGFEDIWLLDEEAKEIPEHIHEDIVEKYYDEICEGLE